MANKLLSKLGEKLVSRDEDPLDSAKRMVNNIQQIVGIRNIFGDKNVNKYTPSSVLLTILFAGCFIYLGQFSQLAYLIQVLPDKVLSFQAMNCFSSTCVPLTKFFFMYLSRNRLKVITKMSREAINSLPRGSSAHKTMMSVLHKARYVSWIVIINQMFTHLVYLLLPIVLNFSTGQRYLPTTPGTIYGLTNVTKYITPYYEITFTITTIATMFSAVNQTGYIVLFVTLLAHELGHFYAICETLNDIYKTIEGTEELKQMEDEVSHDKQKTTDNIQKLEQDDREKQKKILESLQFCVKHHQFIIIFHEKICVLYKLIFGAHFLIMVIVLVTTLQTLNSWDLVNTVLTGVTGIMPLVVYCFGGEMVISAGTEMSQAIYSCGWQGMNVKCARIVLLMLCLSQRPLYYTAAGIFIMNRETFGDVAQVVYKIYAVFN